VDGKAGRNFHAQLKAGSRIEQDVPIKPGNYLLKVNVKTFGLKGKIGVSIAGNENILDILPKPENWFSVSIPFNVPEQADEATLFCSSAELPGDGYFSIDEFRVIANKVAKIFPGSSLKSEKQGDL
jgi:hypothetical protein